MSTTITEPLFRINELPENKQDEELRRWCVEQVISNYNATGIFANSTYFQQDSEELFKYIRNGVLSPKPTGEIKPNK